MATVWECAGSLAGAGGGAGRADAVFAVAREPDAAGRGDAAMIAGASAAATCAGEGAEAGFAPEAEGAAAEPGFRRAAISTTVQRRCGSRCKQWRTMSRKRAGKVSGTRGSCAAEPVEAG